MDIVALAKFRYIRTPCSSTNLFFLNIHKELRDASSGRISWYVTLAPVRPRISIKVVLIYNANLFDLYELFLSVARQPNPPQYPHSWLKMEENIYNPDAKTI